MLLKGKLANYEKRPGLFRNNEYSNVPVNVEWMCNKYFYPSLYLGLDCYSVKDGDNRILNKDVLDRLLTTHGHSPHMKKKIVEACIGEGILYFEDEKVILPIPAPYIKVHPVIVDALLDRYNDFEVKIYCEIRRLYEYWVKRGVECNFSLGGKEGLVSNLGYSEYNRGKMEEAKKGLERLENEGLMKLNSVVVKNGGFKGTYYSIEKVDLIIG